MTTKAREVLADLPCLRLLILGDGLATGSTLVFVVDEQGAPIGTIESETVKVNIGHRHLHDSDGGSCDLVCKPTADIRAVGVLVDLKNTR